MNHNMIAEARIEPQILKIMGALSPREKKVMQDTIRLMQVKE